MPEILPKAEEGAEVQPPAEDICEEPPSALAMAKAKAGPSIKAGYAMPTSAT